MPVRCSVQSCRKYMSQSRNDISFHKFPKDENLKQLWINFCQRGKNWAPKQYSKMCSLHFNKDDFETTYKWELFNIPTKRSIRLKKTAFPSHEDSEDDHVVEEIMREYTDCDYGTEYYDVLEEVGVKPVTKTGILHKNIAYLKRQSEEQEQTIWIMKVLNESLVQDLHEERDRNLYLTNKMNLLKREKQNEVSASHGISGNQNEIVFIVTNDEKHN